ncbi:hypothetical protein H0H87_006778 [Tephrocybe sp. NHM501043]|nr:hypothetical protein H0H87_006778 [Tephrocybe sp. NHM501043]
MQHTARSRTSSRRSSILASGVRSRSQTTASLRSLRTSTTRSQFSSSSKEEDEGEYFNALIKAADVENLHITIKTLVGDNPVYFRPEGQFVDEENRWVYYYWRDVDNRPGPGSSDRPFRLTRLALGSGRWEDLTKRLRKIDPRNPFAEELSPTEAPLPEHRGTADAFCRINGHPVILLFGGTKTNNKAGKKKDTTTSDPLPDLLRPRLKWWKVDIPDKVKPPHGREDGRLLIIGCIFLVASDMSRIRLRSVIRNGGGGLGVVCDEGFPADVPSLGWVGECGTGLWGHAYLVGPGVYQFDFSAKQVVLFEIGKRLGNFHVYDDVKGEFPRDIFGMNSFAKSHTRPPPSVGTSKSDNDENNKRTFEVMLATWHNFVADDSTTGKGSKKNNNNNNKVHEMPKLWVLELSTQQNPNLSQAKCTPVKINKKLKSLRITVSSCAALGDRKLLLFGSSSLVVNEGGMDRCIAISF